MIKSAVNTIGVVGLILVLVFLIFIGPALLVWGLGNIIQGEGYDLNFWSWLGGLAVIISLSSARSS